MTLWVSQQAEGLALEVVAEDGVDAVEVIEVTLGAAVAWVREQVLEWVVEGPA